LETIGIKPLVVPSRLDEDKAAEEVLDPSEMVMTLAARKVHAVAQTYSGNFVLGADTVVVLGDEILGKPCNEEEASIMLRKLSGKTHRVYTGVALYQPEKRTIARGFDSTSVTMRELDSREIAWYVKTGEPMDKAGSYALQGIGAIFVTRIEGDWTSVVGLPLPKVYEMLKEAGFWLEHVLSQR